MEAKAVALSEAWAVEMAVVQAVQRQVTAVAIGVQRGLELARVQVARLFRDHIIRLRTMAQPTVLHKINGVIQCQR